MTEPLLKVEHLRVEFDSRRGLLVAVDDISFDVMPGEVFGIVGESGAGKSLTGQAIIGLLEPPGRIGSVQAQILNLMKSLQKKFGLTYLFISHDLAVVRHMANAVGVMYIGRLCEVAAVNNIFDKPLHPYTQLLLETIPDVEMTGRKRAPVAGEIPNPIDPPNGCAFHPRCPLMAARCREVRAKLATLDSSVQVACHAVIQGPEWRSETGQS